MIKLQQKQVKIISILIAVVFVGSVVALALTQSGSGIASAATSSVGVVDYRQVGSQHPQLAAAASPAEERGADGAHREEHPGRCEERCRKEGALGCHREGRSGLRRTGHHAGCCQAAEQVIRRKCAYVPGRALLGTFL